MWQDPPSHAPALELVAHAPQWALERESRWQRRAPLRGESAAEVSLETRLPPSDHYHRLLHPPAAAVSLLARPREGPSMLARVPAACS